VKGEIETDQKVGTLSLFPFTPHSAELSTMSSPSNSTESIDLEPKDSTKPASPKEVVTELEENETGGKESEEKGGEKDEVQEKDTGNWQAVFSAEANAWYFWSELISLAIDQILPLLGTDLSLDRLCNERDDLDESERTEVASCSDHRIYQSQRI